MVSRYLYNSPPSSSSQDLRSGLGFSVTPSSSSQNLRSGFSPPLPFPSAHRNFRFGFAVWKVITVSPHVLSSVYSTFQAKSFFAHDLKLYLSAFTPLIPFLGDLKLSFTTPVIPLPHPPNSGVGLNVSAFRSSSTFSK